MRTEDRLCLWCKHLRAEQGHELSEITWDSGELSCKKGIWQNTVIGDNVIDDSPAELYEHFIIARTCPLFELKAELVQLVGRQHA